MPDLETRRYVVTGRVQGVGFRWFVEREAAQLGVTGWVRNREDGSVEVMATGTRGAARARCARSCSRDHALPASTMVQESSAPYLEAQSFRIEGVW